MSIDNGRIVSKPTRARSEFSALFVERFSSSEPGTPRRYVDSTGSVVSDEQLPSVEGELFVYRPDTSIQYATLYIAVDIGGTLEWKRVNPMGSAQDRRTGNSWDPLAGFYNVLAS